MKTILIGIAALLLALNLSGCRNETNEAQPESAMETNAINKQDQGDETWRIVNGQRAYLQAGDPIFTRQK